MHYIGLGLDERVLKGGELACGGNDIVDGPASLRARIRDAYDAGRNPARRDRRGMESSHPTRARENDPQLLGTPLVSSPTIHVCIEVLDWSGNLHVLIRTL